jgi:hypothetical protein
MSQQLIVFATKHMREVEEGVPVARKIILSGEGQIFEQWCPVIGLEPMQWAQEATALLKSLEDELPKRRCQMSFTAEDANGAPLAQCLISVTGKNAAVQDLGTQNGAKALSDALASVSKTMEAVLGQARQMMEFQAVQLNKAHDQLGEYVDLFQAIQKVELENGQQENAASQMLLRQVEEASPMIMGLIQHWMTNPAKTAGATSGVAAAATNGKVVTS